MIVVKGFLFCKMRFCWPFQVHMFPRVHTGRLLAPPLATPTSSSGPTRPTPLTSVLSRHTPQLLTHVATHLPPLGVATPEGTTGISPHLQRNSNTAT